MQVTTVQVPGGEMAVQSYGGSGRDVLLLHSVGYCGPQWRRFAEAVTDRCRPFSVDLPGHALSTVPMRGADDQWRHLGAVVRGLGLDRPVLVAHDTAVWAALAATIEEPQLYGALVLVGGSLDRLLETAAFDDDETMRAMLVDRFHLGVTMDTEEEKEAFCDRHADGAAVDWMLTDVQGLRDETEYSVIPREGGGWINTPTPETVIAGFDFEGTAYPIDSRLYERVWVPTWIVTLTDGYDADSAYAVKELVEIDPGLRSLSIESGQWPQYTAIPALADALGRVLAEEPADPAGDAPAE